MFIRTESERLEGGVLAGALIAFLALTACVARREHSARVREEFAAEVPRPLASLAAELGLIAVGLAALALVWRG